MYGLQFSFADLKKIGIYFFTFFNKNSQLPKIQLPFIFICEMAQNIAKNKRSRKKRNYYN